MSTAKRPHWTTGEVLQQILGCEEPAENDIEDPVAEVDRDSQSMEGSDDELLIGKTLERSLEVSITCTNKYNSCTQCMERKKVHKKVQ